MTIQLGIGPKDEPTARIPPAPTSSQYSPMRFFTVSGPRQRPDMAIHKFTRLIDEGKPVPMYGVGDTLRDYTYIDDIVEGVLASIDRPFDFEIINLGEQQTTSLRKLIDILAGQLGKAAVIDELPLQPGDALVTNADISKARRLLDYDPSFAVEEGIARFIEWYRALKAQQAA